MTRTATGSQPAVDQPIKRPARSHDPAWVRVVDRVSRLFAAAGGVFAAIMALQIILEVAGRFFFSTPLPGTFDLVESWYMPIIAVFPMAMAELSNEHVHVTLLVENIRRRAFTGFSILASMLGLVTVFLLLWFSTLTAVAKWEIDEHALSEDWLIVWPVRVLLVIALAAFLLQTFATLYRLSTNRITNKTEADVFNELEGGGVPIVD